MAPSTVLDTYHGIWERIKQWREEGVSNIMPLGRASIMKKSEPLIAD
jgi:hypothetical protein